MRNAAAGTSKCSYGMSTTQEEVLPDMLQHQTLPPFSDLPNREKTSKDKSQA